MRKYFDSVLDDRSGRPVYRCLVDVTDQTAGLAATIYSDDGVTPIVGGLYTDQEGYYEFYADGIFTLTLTYNGQQKVITDVEIFQDGDISLSNPEFPATQFSTADVLTTRRLAAAFTGTHAVQWFVNSIEMLEEGSGAASGPQRAAYPLGISAIKKNWVTSTIAGEMDGISIVGRQGTGDFCCILGNVITRSGFGAFAEASTYNGDVAGAPNRGINVQIGVCNSRDGGEYGFTANALLGSNLSAGLRVADGPSSNFSYAVQYVNAAGTQMFGVKGITGAVEIGGNQVLAARRTGWAAATGTATRTSFATGSVTLPNLAQAVKALIDDLITHGLIGA